MCGIAGYYNVPAANPLLETMCAQLAHRGPDGQGVFSDERAGLAHRRLSIIDLAGGAQPMHSPDGRYVLSYNGEVYNYLALRNEMCELGHRFTTDSDTEVVLASFVQWGSAAFDRFNGMFGLAIYDRQEQRLTLARDHFGIKPVYYARCDSGVLFCSEITPLLNTGLIPRLPDDRTIYRYLRHRVHEEGSNTFFAGVSKLLPGQMLTVDAQGCTIAQYTTLREDLLALAETEAPYDDAAAAAYREQLETSVRLRLQSDVSVGTSLSGGLDSSTVALLISELMTSNAQSTKAVGARQNVFSAVFPHSINDEERYVDAAAEACGDALLIHKIKPVADEFKEEIEDFVRAQEEPLISTGPYAQYKVMQEASKHVKVLLDGQGADETMAGYVPYYVVYLRELKRKRQWGRLFAESVSALDVLFRLARFRIADRLRFKKSIPVTDFIDSGFAANHPDERFAIERNDLKKRLLQDLFENSIPSLLRYEDKNTMHFSIEGRVPFLDKDLLRYLFSLDNTAIIKGGWNKRILRDSMKGKLPDSIVSRRNKIGFTTPEQEWFLRLKNYFYDLFLSESFAQRPYFNQQAVLKAFEGYIAGKSSVDSMSFWRLANIELWLRAFFDEPPAPKPVKQSDFEPNENKNLDLAADGAVFRRYPLRTEKVTAQTDLTEFVREYVERFFAALPVQAEEHRQMCGKPWYLFISEKIVAITQGRSYFIWDIKTGWWARFLSRFVTRTPAGIGLGSPYTMQLAIQEAGLARIIFASIGGALGKLVGKRGVFYQLAGNDIRAIDGPTEYSVYPANVSAKLAPAQPDAVAAQLSSLVRAAVPAPYAENFGGVVIIDANDIGRNVLGTDAPGPSAHYEAAFGDNPLGQAHEQTPLCLVFESA
ncbi:MAG: asparagine synthase (glutamine-hydrolyzing) [Coriobacteriales bacterium]|jgi:asparagine synthase (glutamine-hydrolysing)|nr:asparagine synthase (glutamine-hydrolyzing) [Coriobacteriales bacterium]